MCHRRSAYVAAPGVRDRSDRTRIRGFPDLLRCHGGAELGCDHIVVRRVPQHRHLTCFDGEDVYSHYLERPSTGQSHADALLRHGLPGLSAARGPHPISRHRPRLVPSDANLCIGVVFVCVLDEFCDLLWRVRRSGIYLSRFLVDGIGRLGGIGSVAHEACSTPERSVVNNLDRRVRLRRSRSRSKSTALPCAQQELVHCSPQASSVPACWHSQQSRQPVPPVPLSRPGSHRSTTPAFTVTRRSR